MAEKYVIWRTLLFYVQAAYDRWEQNGDVTAWRNEPLGGSSSSRIVLRLPYRWFKAQLSPLKTLGGSIVVWFLKKSIGGVVSVSIEQLSLRPK